ncbi:hypothetical protein WT21_12080 [Burkholderia territorii]|uniref:hypothetical protein n=1 Tax=Burkholderia territorii TaxID=1503055 RepID=UPI000757700E|nr:hypothetical protein [Burkholderia territorii]KVQ50260.1 hypothetical protein WT21_12080 [Burkholderia territorii]
MEKIKKEPNMLSEVHEYLIEYTKELDIPFDIADLDRPVSESDIGSIEFIGFIAACENRYNVQLPTLPAYDFGKVTPRAVIDWIDENRRRVI